MQLEESPLKPPEPTSKAGALTVPRAGAALRLTHEELSAVLDDAIARQGLASRVHGNTASLEDVLDVASQLNIPHEYVLSALTELRQRKLRQAKKAAKRRERKAAVTRFVAPILGLPAAWIFANMITHYGDAANLGIVLYLIGHVMVHGALWWQSLNRDEDDE